MPAMRLSPSEMHRDLLLTFVVLLPAPTCRMQLFVSLSFVLMMQKCLTMSPLELHLLYAQRPGRRVQQLRWSSLRHRPHEQSGSRQLCSLAYRALTRACLPRRRRKASSCLQLALPVPLGLPDRGVTPCALLLQVEAARVLRAPLFIP